jgi:hypothetical protein
MARASLADLDRTMGVLDQLDLDAVKRPLCCYQSDQWPARSTCMAISALVTACATIASLSSPRRFCA